MGTQRRFALLRSLISAEQGALDRLRDEAAELAGRDAIDGAHVRALGSVLHDWYTGCEKAFRRIAVEVDGQAPASASWHTDLLEQMTAELPGARPAVIDRALAADLRELLGFRHLFRNVYGFELRWDRMVDLVKRLPPVHERLQDALSRFVSFLERIDALD